MENGSLSSGHAPKHVKTERLVAGDWTADEEPSGLTEFQRFARGVDWSKTGLGPMNSWSAELRRSLIFMLVDPRPASLLWGPDRVAVYNEQSVVITCVYEECI